MGTLMSLLSQWHTFSDQFKMPFQNNKILWKAIGFGGTATFFTRFIVQWIYSEKRKESKVPVIFWWQSLLGAVLMLLYSLRQKDSVYILGYIFTVVPYSRNLVLVYRKRRQQNQAPAELPQSLKPS
jgi:lipid-A-disaccharide synthase-like uncharacterized protein